MSDSNEFKKIAEELIEKVQKDREQAKNSKETIWDYNPTEEELGKKEELKRVEREHAICFPYFL